MRASSASRPNGIMDLGLDDGPVITDVYASEEDQDAAQREVDEQQQGQPQPAPLHRNVHVHIHRKG